MFDKTKKLYSIMHAKCIVTRKNKIKEIDTFSFLNCFGIYDKSVNIYNSLLLCLQKQIDFYNEFCFESSKILKFEDVKFEQVGEIWL